MSRWCGEGGRVRPACWNRRTLLFENDKVITLRCKPTFEKHCAGEAPTAFSFLALFDEACLFVVWRADTENPNDDGSGGPGALRKQCFVRSYSRRREDAKSASKEASWSEQES